MHQRFHWVFPALLLSLFLSAPALGEPASWGQIKTLLSESEPDLSFEEVLAVANRHVEVDQQALRIEALPSDGSFQVSGLDTERNWFGGLVSPAGEFLGGARVNLSTGLMEWIPGKELDPSDPEFYGIKETWNSVKNFCKRVLRGAARGARPTAGPTKWALLFELLHQLINEHCEQGEYDIEQVLDDDDDGDLIGNSPQDSTGGS